MKDQSCVAKWKDGLHKGLTANGLSALIGALAIIGIRTLRPHDFPVNLDEHMQGEIAIGGALISYFIATMERKAKWVSDVVTAGAVVFTALMALRFSTIEWKSVQTVFAVTAAMKPIGARAADFLSPLTSPVRANGYLPAAPAQQISTS